MRRGLGAMMAWVALAAAVLAAVAGAVRGGDLVLFVVLAVLTPLGVAWVACQAFTPGGPPRGG